MCFQGSCEISATHRKMSYTKIAVLDIAASVTCLISLIVWNVDVYCSLYIHGRYPIDWLCPGLWLMLHWIAMKLCNPRYHNCLLRSAKHVKFVKHKAFISQDWEEIYLPGKKTSRYIHGRYPIDWLCPGLWLMLHWIAMKLFHTV